MYRAVTGLSHTHTHTHTHNYVPRSHTHTHTTMYRAVTGPKLDWNVLLKFKHPTRELVIDKPDVNISVYFLKWTEPGPYVTADLGFVAGELAQNHTPRTQMVCMCVFVTGYV
jgi:hypothetical protein